jgi:hypothetical protein
LIPSEVVLTRLLRLSSHSPNKSYSPGMVIEWCVS